MKHSNDPDTLRAASLKESPIKKLTRFSIKGRFQRAISLGNELHAADPKNPHIAAWLGYCLTQTGDKQRAQELLESSITSNIHSMIPRIAFLRSLICERSERVRKVFLQLSEKSPSISRSYLSVDSPGALGKAYAEIVSHYAPLVSPDQLVFYHLPFTGGTSIQVALRLAFEKNVSFNIKRRSGLRNISRFESLTDKEVTPLRYIHLHHPYPLDTRAKAPVYFTVLRDPVSFFLSGYFKRRNLGSKIMPSRDMLIEGGGLSEAIEFAREHRLHNGLTKQLAILHPSLRKSFAARYRTRRSFSEILLRRRPHNDRVEYVTYEEDLFYPEATAGLSENDLLELATEVLVTRFDQAGVIKHLDASFFVAMARLGLEVSPRIPHYGASHGPARESINPEIKDRITDLNRIDQLLYNRSVDEFEKKHFELIAAVAADKAAISSTQS